MIYMMCGIPGSGKTTRAFDIKKSLEASGDKCYFLSSDYIREFFLRDVKDQRYNRAIFSTMRYWLDSILYHCKISDNQMVDKDDPNLKVHIILDATFIKKEYRKQMIDVVKKHHMEKQINCQFMDTSLSECMRRNKARNRVVPEKVLCRMYADLEEPKSGEGFEVVITTKQDEAQLKLI